LKEKKGRRQLSLKSHRNVHGGGDGVGRDQREKAASLSASVSAYWKKKKNGKKAQGLKARLQHSSWEKKSKKEKIPNEKSGDE